MLGLAGRILVEVEVVVAGRVMLILKAEEGLNWLSFGGR